MTGSAPARSSRPSTFCVTSVQPVRVRHQRASTSCAGFGDCGPEHLPAPVVPLPHQARVVRECFRRRDGLRPRSSARGRLRRETWGYRMQSRSRHPSARSRDAREPDGRQRRRGRARRTGYVDESGIWDLGSQGIWNLGSGIWIRGEARPSGWSSQIPAPSDSRCSEVPDSRSQIHVQLTPAPLRRLR